MAQDTVLKQRTSRQGEGQAGDGKALRQGSGQAAVKVAEIAGAERTRGGEGVRLSARDMTLMQAGALLMSNARRRRDEVEDLILIGQLHETGDYRRIVQDAGAEGKPWNAFCGLIGYRKKTLDERLKALREFGPEVLGLMLKSGMPQHGIRAMLAEPGELLSAIKARGGEVTAEDVMAIFSQMQAERDRGERAKGLLAMEKAAREKAEKKLGTTTEKLSDTRQGLLDAKAQIKQLETAKKITNAVEVERTLRVATEGLAKIENVLGAVDCSASQKAAGVFLQKLDAMIPALMELRADVQEEAMG